MSIAYRRILSLSFIGASFLGSQFSVLEKAHNNLDHSSKPAVTLDGGELGKKELSSVEAISNSRLSGASIGELSFDEVWNHFHGIRLANVGLQDLRNIRVFGTVEEFYFVLFEIASSDVERAMTMLDGFAINGKAVHRIRLLCDLAAVQGEVAVDWYLSKYKDESSLDEMGIELKDFYGEEGNSLYDSKYPNGLSVRDGELKLMMESWVEDDIDSAANYIDENYEELEHLGVESYISYELFIEKDESEYLGWIDSISNEEFKRRLLDGYLELGKPRI